jgi:cellulose biosynthesis protein BcsQ
MRTIAFFNNKGGVGKTSLVYHLGWTYADRGERVLMVDFDPQSNLTAMCIEEDRLEQLWGGDDARRLTVRGAVQPIVDGIGDIRSAHQEAISTRLSLVPGDIRLAGFEAKLWDAWPRCLDKDPAAFRATSAFHRLVQDAAASTGSNLVLLDVGPNLGAINRCALVAADHVVTPLGADLFSIQGLRNLGPTLSTWRLEWHERRAKNPVVDLPLPEGTMSPAGYVVMQPNLYGGKVTRAYTKWLDLLPTEFHQARVFAQREDSRLVESHES